MSDIELNQRLRFNNEFLNTYLDYVEYTETPRTMHIMAVISGAAACLGRRVYLPWGNGAKFSNLYVALVGPPGSRKSTAVDIMAKHLGDSTGIRFAPDDTGGARQGLIKAIIGNNSDEMKEVLDEIKNNASLSVEALQNIRFSCDSDPRDSHCLYVCASEFNSLLGSNATDMLPLLNKAYDGENYIYMLKNDQMVLDNPLLNIIGCTTPTNIATSLPPEAIGQGFMSRIILVFGNKKYRSCPRLLAFDQGLGDRINAKFKQLFYEMDGPMSEAPDAAKALDRLYTESIDIHDHRFVYYCERRHSHLVKICMVFAALRGSYTIEFEDVREASILLRAIEQYMPDALGEYGLSKLSVAKQKLIEFLRAAKVPVNPQILFAMMGKDMNFVDFKNTIADLANAEKIKLVDTSEGKCWMYKDTKSDAIEDIIAELQETGAIAPMMKSNVVPLKVIGHAD